MRRKKLLALTAATSVAVTATLSLAACGSSAGSSGGAGSSAASGSAASGMSAAESALYQAALKEGSVSWYSEADDQQAIADFGKRYPGIKVNFLRLPSGQLSTRFDQEASTGTIPADLVLSSNQSFMTDAQSKGWLRTTLPSMPATASWPASYIKNGMVEISIAPTGIAYNTNLVSANDVPKTWADVVDPKYKTFAIPDAGLVPQFLAQAYVLEKQYGVGFLKKIAALKPTVQASTQTINQSLASGGTAMAIMDVKATVSLLQSQGAPIKYVQLSPTTGNEFKIGITKGAEHPNAAALLLNYLMTKPGQQAFAVGQVSPLGGLPGTIPMPANYVSVDQATVNAQKSQILAAMGLKS